MADAAKAFAEEKLALLRTKLDQIPALQEVEVSRDKMIDGRESFVFEWVAFVRSFFVFRVEKTGSGVLGACRSSFIFQLVSGLSVCLTRAHVATAETNDD